MLRELARAHATRCARGAARRARSTSSCRARSFALDERGYPIDARPAPRNDAHRAIEEAMLAANRAVAEWLVEHGVEAVHRIHEPPAPPDLERPRRRAHRAGPARRRRRGRAAGARARARARARGGQPRRALDPPARAAQHAPRALQRALGSALRARLRALSALHLADPPLSGPRRAPRAQGGARGRSARRSRARAPRRSRCAARSASAWRWLAEREMDQIKACVLLARPRRRAARGHGDRPRAPRPLRDARRVVGGGPRARVAAARTTPSSARTGARSCRGVALRARRPRAR